MLKLVNMKRKRSRLLYGRSAQISKKERKKERKKEKKSHLRILGARNVKYTKFHLEDTKIVGATFQTVT